MWTLVVHFRALGEEGSGREGYNSKPPRDPPFHLPFNSTPFTPSQHEYNYRAIDIDNLIRNTTSPSNLISSVYHTRAIDGIAAASFPLSTNRWGRGKR